MPQIAARGKEIEWKPGREIEINGKKQPAMHINGVKPSATFWCTTPLKTLASSTRRLVV